MSEAELEELERKETEVWTNIGMLIFLLNVYKCVI